MAIPPRKLLTLSTVLVPPVALLIVLLAIAPGQIWRHPAIDQTYTGFDPNLIFGSSGGASGGGVTVSDRSIGLEAAPSAEPAVTLLATPFSRFDGALDLNVLHSGSNSVPLRLGIWSPAARSGVFVSFSDAGRAISSQVIEDGTVAATLEQGRVVASQPLGTFQPGEIYRVDFHVDKGRGIISLGVSNGVERRSTITSASAQPALFQSVRLALTASALGNAGGSDAVLDHYSLALPHQVYWADKVADPVESLVVILLGIAALTVVCLTILSGLANRFHPLRMLRAAADSLRARIREMRGTVVLGVAGIVALYLVGNALLFHVGGHPFDMTNEKIYAYVGGRHGPSELYYLPNLVSPADVWGGTPYSEAAFPYGATLAYLFGLIGISAQNLSLVLGGFSPHGPALEYAIKATNVLFGLGDALLIWATLRLLNTGRRWSLVGALLFLFNPAVWFSMSVWGQTHVISLFFVLAAIWLAELRRPTLAWLALGVSVMTRPQMLVVGVLLGAILLRKFPIRENLRAGSIAIATAFALLLPLTLQTSPSLSTDIYVNDFRIQETGGNEPGLTTVSQDAYSIWPLLTFAAKGSSGLGRSFTPSRQSLVGPITYQLAGQILTLTALLAVAGLLLFRRRTLSSSGQALMLLAIGLMAFLMLTTGLVATHFLLALPLILLCRRWIGTGAYLYIVAIWTVGTLVPMWGDMGNALSILNFQNAPLNPDHNSLTRLVVGVYTSDRFITAAVVGNLCAVLWLTVLALRLREPMGLIEQSS